MGARQEDIFPAESEGDALIKRLKRHRKIALWMALLIAVCGFVAGNKMIVLGLAPIPYWLWVNRRLQVELAEIERARQAHGIGLPDKGWLSLVGQILPPLFMLPLFVMPWDNPEVIYWLICGIAALISLANLLLWSLSASRRPAWKVRSQLTVAIFSAAVVVGYVVQAESDRYVKNLASDLQRACKDSGRCLPAPKGWRVEGKIAHANHGHWELAYLTNADKSEFGLWVHRSYENEKCIHGGSTINLSEVLTLFCDSDSSSSWQYK